MKGVKADKMIEQQRDTKIFSTIFYYSFLIILGPVVIFFGTKVLLLDGLFGVSSVASNVWSAIVAIIVLHIILGMYIYRAYSEPSRAKPDKLD